MKAILGDYLPKVLKYGKSTVRPIQKRGGHWEVPNTIILQEMIDKYRNTLSNIN